MSAVTTPVASSFSAYDLLSEGGYSGPNGGAAQPYAQTFVGLGAGIGFNPKTVGSAISPPLRLSNSATLTTGLQVQVVFADNPADPNADPGAVGYFDFTIGPITSGTSTLDGTTTADALHGSTAVTASLTTASTAGVLKTATVSIPSADLNSLAAGGWFVLRIRRQGTNASDTHTGRVIILGYDVIDY